MTVEPQHIIHFRSFNLVVSLGKFFWRPRPAVKQHYSIIRELLLEKGFLRSAIIYVPLTLWEIQEPFNFLEY